MKDSLLDLQLQQEKIKSNVDLMQQTILTILSVSQNTEIFTKMRENESHIAFRQQLNAVQNNSTRSSLNCSSDLSGVGSEIANDLSGHEKVKNKKFVNVANDIARRKNTESKDNLSSFLSETNFSKEDLMDIFAKAIAGASKSTPVTASDAKGSASNKTKIVHSRKIVRQDSEDSGDQSDSASVSNDSVRSVSCSPSSDESEYDDMDVDKQVRENLRSEMHRNILRSSHSPSNRTHPSNRITRAHQEDRGSNVKEDSSNRRRSNTTDRPGKGVYDDFDEQKGSHARQAVTRASSKSAKNMTTTLKNNDRKPTLNSRVSSNRDVVSGGGPANWIPESEYTSRQVRPVAEGQPYTHGTERGVYFEGKTHRRSVRDEGEDYKIGVNYNKENAIALQAARDISGVYVSPHYQDSVYQQTEGTTAYPYLHCTALHSISYLPAYLKVTFHLIPLLIRPGTKFREVSQSSQHTWKHTPTEELSGYWYCSQSDKSVPCILQQYVTL